MKQLVNFFAVIIFLNLFLFGSVAKAEDINVKVLGSSYLPNMNGGTPGSEVVFVNKSFDMDSVKTILNSQGRYAINNLYTGMTGIDDVPTNNAVGTTIVFNNTNLIYGGTDAKISLTNIKGADVSSNVSVQEENDFTTAFFNPNGLAKGTYIYKVEGKNGFSSVNRIVYDGGVVNDAHPQPSLIQKVTPKINLEDVVRSSPKGGIHPGDVHTWYVGIKSIDGSFAMFEDSLEVTIPASSADLVTLYPVHYLEWNENWRNIEGVIRNGHDYTIGDVDAKNPVSNANVALVLNDNVIANVTTGADGKYEFKHIAGGNVYTVEVRDLNGEFRANKFLAEVPDRFFEADTIAVNRFFEHIADGYSGTGNFDQCMFEDAYEYLAKDTLGVRSLACPELETYPNQGMDRMVEGQCGPMSDGLVFADAVMDRVLKFYNPTSTQYSAIRSFFNLFDGIPYSEVNNKFQIVYTPLVQEANNDNIFGGVNEEGINLGTDGNNTYPWISNLAFSSDLYNVSSIVSGADINSIGIVDTYHERLNTENTGVTSEASINGATAIDPTPRDISSHQLVGEVKQSIYKDGIHSGTVYELKDSVPDRKYNINNKNVFDFKIAR